MGKIMPFKIHHQIICGISTTRGSDKNSFKYALTALAVGAEGVPKFSNKTAVFEGRRWGF
jgi:hypothetical protein